MRLVPVLHGVPTTKPEQNPMSKKTMTCGEAAMALQVSRRTVARAVNRGTLEGVFGGIDGRRIRGVSVASVNRLLRERARGCAK